MHHSLPAADRGGTSVDVEGTHSTNKHALSFCIIVAFSFRDLKFAHPVQTKTPASSLPEVPEILHQSNIEPASKNDSQPLERATTGGKQNNQVSSNFRFMYK